MALFPAKTGTFSAFLGQSVTKYHTFCDRACYFTGRTMAICRLDVLRKRYIVKYCAILEK